MLITLNVTDIEDARADLPDTQGALDFSIATGPQGFDDDPLLNLGDELEPERKRSEIMGAPMDLDMETGVPPEEFEVPDVVGVATPMRTPIGQDIPQPTFQPTTPIEPGTPSTGLPTPLAAPPKKQKKRKITIDASTFLNSE